CPAPATTTTTAMKSTSGTTNAGENAVKKLTVKVMPNPSATHFTLMLKSPKNDRVNMKIMDLTGRVIEEKLNVAPNGTTQLGANYFPGMFIAEVIQGKERVSVKLIKTYR
ncbi:MAG TPA: T9SS type A sorting domain-containing protein, partial [Segetibacter sp.]|nr:T9SS type A sorting domain-containing protein [Segetibacter sp.]